MINREVIFDSCRFRLEPYDEGQYILTLNSKFVGMPMSEKDGLIVLDWLRNGFLEFKSLLEKTNDLNHEH